MVVNPDGPLCRCGRQGCWELLVCNAATRARYNATTRFHPARFDLLCGKAAQGEAEALSALDATALVLSLGISNIVLALHPEAVVVAGQITTAWDLVRPIIERTSAIHNIPLRIRPARRSANELFLQGAVDLALSPAFARPGVTTTPW